MSFSGVYPPAHEWAQHGITVDENSIITGTSAAHSDVIQTVCVSVCVLTNKPRQEHFFSEAIL